MKPLIRRVALVAAAAAALTAVVQLPLTRPTESSQALTGAGSVTEVQITGRAGVPNNASAVVLNLTAVDATTTGYVTAYPCGSTRPNVSNLNYTPGTPIANSATIPIGTGGKICLYTDSPVNLIADINGWYPAGSDFTPTTPTRLLDTRPTRTGAGSVTEVQITGRAGVPNNASAAVLNLTAADATTTGYVTAYPCGSTRPNVSNLNYTPGTPIANSATIPIGTGGKICLYTDSPVNLIADINGWYPANSDFTPTTPTRLLDTRPTRTGAGSVTEVQITGRAGVPNNASAAVLNLTAADATTTGYVTAYPCGSTRPNVSNLNYTPGTPIANSATIPIGTGGKICLYTDSPVNLIADINGWYPANSDFTPTTPTRLLDTRVPTAPSMPSGAAFVETFDGNVGLDRFRTGVFYRERDAYGEPMWVSPATWGGDHDTSCGAPTTKRTLAARDASGKFNDASLLYTCKDHMMTSMADVSGYSIVWFSPKQTFSKVNEVCFDVNVSTGLLGPRQWWEVAVVPVDATEVFANEFISGTAETADYGDVGATVLSFGANAEPGLGLDVGNNPVGEGTPRIDAYRSDIATRVQHCFADLGNGTLRVSTFNDDGSPYTLTAKGSFPAGQVKVVFKDHNYTPDKDCGRMPGGHCQSYTWHWDNIIVRGT